MLWGADDFAAPVAGAHRFEGEIPGSEVVVLDGTGHFVVEDAPDRYAEELRPLPQEGAPGHGTLSWLSPSLRSSTAPVGSTSTVRICPV